MESDDYTVKHGRSGVISFMVPEQKRANRLQVSTLGDSFDPENIREVIARKHLIPDVPEAVVALRRMNLIIDILQRMTEGKGPAYARWSKVYNLKQVAAALQYIREQGLTDYDALAAKTNTVIVREHALDEDVK